MIEFFLFLLAGVGITNLIVNAGILEGPRNYLSQHSKFLGDLVSCMMCSGVWVGVILGLFFGFHPVLSGAAISFLSYVVSEILECLAVSKAVMALELSDVEDDENE